MRYLNCDSILNRANITVTFESAEDISQSINYSDKYITCSICLLHTCVSDRLSWEASSTLSGVDKYFWASNLSSRPFNCWSLKTVLAFRRRLCLLQAWFSEVNKPAKWNPGEWKRIKIIFYCDCIIITSFKFTEFKFVAIYHNFIIVLYFVCDWAH